MTSRWYRCALPANRLARSRRVEPEALVGERWIAFPSGPNAAREPYLAALDHRLAVCGLSPSEIIPIDSLTAQKRMVEAGFGLARSSQQAAWTKNYVWARCEYFALPPCAPGFLSSLSIVGTRF
jgi:DNA-binding transcriptional LysR family regulator